MTPPTPPTPPAPPASAPGGQAADAEKRASFEREALVHLDSLYRVALRLTGNAAEADDLVQETMLKAYRAWHQFERGTNAKGWLLTILRHAFINEYRRRARHPESVDIDAIEIGRASCRERVENSGGAGSGKKKFKRARQWS